MSSSGCLECVSNSVIACRAAFTTKLEGFFRELEGYFQRFCGAWVVVEIQQSSRIGWQIRYRDIYHNKQGHITVADFHIIRIQVTVCMAMPWAQQSDFLSCIPIVILQTYFMYKATCHCFLQPQFPPVLLVCLTINYVWEAWALLDTILQLLIGTVNAYILCCIAYLTQGQHQFPS